MLPNRNIQCTLLMCTVLGDTRVAKSRSSRPSQRGPSPTARSPLLGGFISTPVNVTLGGDRRLYHPLGPYRPVFASPRAAARLVISKTKSRRPILHPGLQFSVPEKVTLCVRRKRRKEVLFAKKKTRKGAASSRRRRSYWSNIKC